MIAYADRGRVHRSTTDTSYSNYDGWDDTSTTAYWCEPNGSFGYHETKLRDEELEDPFIQYLTHKRHKSDCKRGTSPNLFGHGLVKSRNTNIKVIPYYKRRILRCNRKGIGLRR